MSKSTPLAEQLIAHAKATGAKSLDLGRCGLTDWPDSLWELTELEELTMSNQWWDMEERKWIETNNRGPYNLLRSIPTEIQKLKKLWLLRAGVSGYISIFGNTIFYDSWGIKDISVLQGLTNLQSLDLQRTQVEDISPLLPIIRKGVRADVKEHAYGEGIHLHGCPLQTPPPEVVGQGNDAILRYFEQLEAEGVDYIYEAKMLIVGKGGSGKTSLAVKLRDPEAELLFESWFSFLVIDFWP